MAHQINSDTPTLRHSDTIIIGGGIIGMTIALHLAKEKQKVLIIEKNLCGRGTSWAAAGLLTPINELEFLEEDVMHLSAKSLQMYPKFVNDLGENVELRYDGTLMVGLEEDDKPYIRRMYEYQKELGPETKWLEGNDLQKEEPYLSPKIEFGSYCKSDIQVDNHLLVDALKKKCLSLGVEIHEDEEAVSLMKAGKKVIGVKTNKNNYSAKNTVVAIGVSQIGDEKFPFRIRPVRGQVIELELPKGGTIKKNVRIKNMTLGMGYLVPKHNRLVCGSTAEEMGSETKLTAGGMMDVLRKCYAAVPSIYDLHVKNIYSGLRPTTIDHKPVLGKADLENLFIANGMYRHGILLAPIVGKMMSELILTGKIPNEIKEFGIGRFAEAEYK